MEVKFCGFASSGRDGGRAGRWCCAGRLLLLLVLSLEVENLCPTAGWSVSPSRARNGAQRFEEAGRPCWTVRVQDWTYLDLLRFQLGFEVLEVRLDALAVRESGPRSAAFCLDENEERRSGSGESSSAVASASREKAASHAHLSTDPLEPLVDVLLGLVRLLLHQDRPDELEDVVLRCQRGEFLCIQERIPQSARLRRRRETTGMKSLVRRTFLTLSFSVFCASSRCRASTALA